MDDHQSEIGTLEIGEKRTSEKIMRRIQNQLCLLVETGTQMCVSM